jgi:DNA-sulfur modification-associated
MLELVLQGVPVQYGQERISYMTSLCFGDIIRLFNEGRLHIPTDIESNNPTQYQIDDERLIEFRNYILLNYQQGMNAINPICINAFPEPVYKDGNICFPYESLCFRLIDGQHRCFAIRQAWEVLKEQKPSDVSSFAQLELTTLIYPALPLDFELKAYRDLRLSQLN